MRICAEYFTIGYPPVFHAESGTLVAQVLRILTESPTLLALGWGILATWWVGFIVGAPLAFICVFGPRPKLRWRKLIAPVAILLATMAVVSAAFGVVAYSSAKAGHIWLREPLASRLPVEKHSTYLADLWAHFAGHGAGLLGGIVVWFYAWWKRRFRTKTELPVWQPEDEVSRN